MILTDKHNRPTYTAPQKDITNSPPPSAHHRRVGVDKSLRQQSAPPPSLFVLHPSRKAKLRAGAARPEPMWLAYPTSRDSHKSWDLAPSERKHRAKVGLRWGEGELEACGRSLSVSGCPSSSSIRVQAFGYCHTAVHTPYYSDQSLVRLTGVAVRASGTREWKRRTWTGKARAGCRRCPRALRAPCGRAGGRTHARTHARRGL